MLSARCRRVALPDAALVAYARAMKNRKVIGIVIGLIGVVLVVVAVIADYIGLSSGGAANSFGQRQMLVAGVGALLIVAGGAIAFLRRS
jgi:uncharacterized membrane protein